MRFPALDVPLEYVGIDGPVSVYALVDPRDRTVRYVGRTVNRETRLGTHTSKTRSNRRKREWLADLEATGLRPLFVELERCQETAFAPVERKWIAHYRAIGDLYNVRYGDNDSTPLGVPTDVSFSVGIHLPRAHFVRLKQIAKAGRQTVDSLVRNMVVSAVSQGAKL